MRPQLLLNAPPELTIFYNADEPAQDSILSGSVSCTNMQALNTTSMVAQVSLICLGSFKKESHAEDKHTKRSYLPFSRHRSLQEPWNGLDEADEILSTELTFSSHNSKHASARFEFTIPSSIAPTTNFPTFAISYTLLVASTLPWGQVLRTSRILQISRRPVEPIPMRSTPTAYSHSPLSLCVSFDRPYPRSNDLSAVLHLCSTTARLAGSLEWHVEERATITTQDPDATPISKALRTIDQGTCVYRQSLRSSAEQVDVVFTITIPHDTEFPSAIRADSCVLNAWSPKHARCQKMGFKIELKQVLRIRLHLDQDTTGRRDVAQDVYSVVLPLEGLHSKFDSAGVIGGETQHARKYCITREVA